MEIFKYLQNKAPDRKLHTSKPQNSPHALNEAGRLFNRNSELLSLNFLPDSNVQ